MRTPEPDRQFSDQRLADLYDLGNAGSDDRDFYLGLAGEQPLDILDLGCGTGLLCQAYAAQGHRVMGVDPAAAMLAVAKRGDPGDLVSWAQSRSEDFRSDRTFDLIIMTGHAFQVLLGDAQVEATFATMAAHLYPDGLITFESRNPALNWDAIWGRTYKMETPQGPVRAARRMTDTSRAPHYLSFAWDYHFADETLTSESTLRFMSHREIVSFAEAAGLRLVQLLGDWDGSKFDADTSREMIFKFRRSD